MRRPPSFPVLGVAALAGVLAASCGTGETATGPTFVDVPETVAIGQLPEEPPVDPPPAPPTTAPPTTVDPTATSVAPDDRVVGPLVDEVFDNRVLLIGDEVMATAAPRFLGSMCAELTARGWEVEIAAEPGRFVRFANEVLDRRLRPDGGLDRDVVGILLGNRYDSDFPALIDAYEAAIAAVAPRPMLLYTVTEFDDGHRRINTYIRDRVRFHPGVVVVDWAAETAENPDLLKFPDTPTPSEAGMRRLVEMTADALGEWSGGKTGLCVPPVFTDDSAIVL